MTEPHRWREELEGSVADQAEYIIEEFRAASDGRVELELVPANRGIGYLYARNRLLVRDEYLERVLEILRELDERGAAPDEPRADAAREPGREQEEPRIQRVIAGVVLLRLAESEPSVPDALAEIDRQLGRGAATPDHVLTVSGGEVSGCPATEPEQVYYQTEPYPSVCPDSGGSGVLIYLADTGLLADADASHPWLAGVRRGDAADLDALGPADTIRPYTGHGTFVAGVTRCMAPQADIIVTNAFAVAGSTLESDLVPRLAGALGLGVDIFHLTMAAPSRHDLPLIAFEAWLRLLRQYKGVVCVVAAGNSASRRPSWPAAFAEVVSVGALGADWRSRASFSNYGGWVDVYAPGRDLVNAFATGTYTCYVWPYKPQERKFYGMAKWSGTSFSTPVVTGLIASRMSRTGENGREAADALLAEARARAIAGVGAILLPCCAGDGGHREGGRPGCCCERRSCRC